MFCSFWTKYCVWYFEMFSLISFYWIFDYWMNKICVRHVAYLDILNKYLYMFLINYLDTGTPVLRRVNVTFGIPLHAYTQLPGLMVTVCSTRHTYLSISGKVHNRHCYCYWCYTHIIVTGAIRTSLLLVLYAHYCYWSPITDITFLLSILFQPF